MSGRVERVGRARLAGDVRIHAACRASTGWIEIAALSTSVVLMLPAWP